MTWVRIDDGYAEHPKLLAVGPVGMALHVAALCYASRNLTDGFVPESALSRLISVRDIRAAIARNIAVGLFELGDGGCWIHDYLAYNPSRERVLSERSSARERMAEHRRSGDVRPNNGRSSPEVQRPRPLPVPLTVLPEPSVPTEPLPTAPLVAVGATAGKRKKPDQEDASGQTRKTVADTAFQAKLVTEYAAVLGGEAACRDVIAAALSYAPNRKYGDQRAMLRNWLRRDADRAVGGRRNGAAAAAAIVDVPPEEEDRRSAVCPQCGELSTSVADWGVGGGPMCRSCCERLARA